MKRTTTTYVIRTHVEPPPPPKRRVKPPPPMPDREVLRAVAPWDQCMFAIIHRTRRATQLPSSSAAALAAGAAAAAGSSSSAAASASSSSSSSPPRSPSPPAQGDDTSELFPASPLPLPDEMMALILDHLSGRDIVALALTCREGTRWRRTLFPVIVTSPSIAHMLACVDTPWVRRHFVNMSWKTPGPFAPCDHVPLPLLRNYMYVEHLVFGSSGGAEIRGDMVYWIALHARTGRLRTLHFYKCWCADTKALSDAFACIGSTVHSVSVLYSPTILAALLTQPMPDARILTLDICTAALSMPDLVYSFAHVPHLTRIRAHAPRSLEIQPGSTLTFVRRLLRQRGMPKEIVTTIPIDIVPCVC